MPRVSPKRAAMDPAWMEILCTALIVSYASNPYTVMLLPKGKCPLCCPYKRDDIKLYITIPGGPVEEYLDWENGSDWRILDNNRTVTFYIHGFTEMHLGPAAREVRQAYLERGEDNLVVVDWSSLSAAPWYNAAVTNTAYVASFLAGVIDSLVIRGLPLENFHIIGFSLGAEIAGLLSKRMTVGKLRRVTGLDPALPLYDPLDPKGRLDKMDAEFVDVIHTDGGVFGFKTAIGHADFYPNGGKPNQPGCRTESLVKTGRIDEFVACSHNRAWKFYAESVRDPKAFPAIKCSSDLSYAKGKCKQTGPIAYMGYRADPKLRGKFFLQTKQDRPYGLGPHHKVQTSYGLQQQHTGQLEYPNTAIGYVQVSDQYPPSYPGYAISEEEFHHYLSNGMHQERDHGNQQGNDHPLMDIPYYNYLEHYPVLEPYYTDVAYPTLTDLDYLPMEGELQRSVARRRSTTQRVSRPLRRWLLRNVLQQKKKETAARKHNWRI